MTTTVNTRNGSIPFSVALENARKAYLAGAKRNVRSMTTKELEKRRTEVCEYLALSKIARMTDSRGIQHAAFTGWFTTR